MSLEQVNKHRDTPLTQEEYEALLRPVYEPEYVAPRKTPLPEGLTLDEPEEASKKKE